ncbi:MAG: RusA family crossover junction endodeoxyribonuclease [Pseudomonadales bacterium]|nr:RusA family crossover junction endodeoxyribonuclease [Pseudomonadales bacterium]
MTTAARIEITLPWPPSVNGYYRAIVRGKHATQILSAKGRAYKQAVLEIVIADGNPSVLGTVKVTERFYPPDLKKRDIDNHRKAYRDGIENAGVIENDCLIKEDHGYWCEVDRKNPRVELVIERIGGAA